MVARASCLCKAGRCDGCNAVCKRCACRCGGRDPALRRHGGVRRGAAYLSRVAATSRRFSTRSSAREAQRRLVEAAERSSAIRDSSRAASRTTEDNEIIYYESELPTSAVTDLSQLAAAVGLQPRALTKNIPSREKRTSCNIARVEKRESQRTLASCKHILKKVTELFWPGDPEGFFEAFLQYLIGKRDPTKEKRFVDEAFRIAWRCKRGTIERRTISALLCHVYSRREIEKGLERRIDVHCQDGSSSEEENEGRAMEDENISSGMVFLEGASGGTGKQESGRNSMNRKAYTNARKDFHCLEFNGRLERTVHSRKIMIDSTIEHALKFILHQDNAQQISWGSKKVMVDGAIRQLPAITRKRKRINIWRAYSKICERDESASMGRSTFFKVINRVTQRDQKSKTAVDYVKGALIHDNFEVIRRVLNSVMLSIDIRRCLLSRMDAVCNFIKVIYSPSTSTKIKMACIIVYAL